jgi:hypothetical protein
MASASNYFWQIGTEAEKGNVVTYLIGYPAASI